MIVEPVTSWRALRLILLHGLLASCMFFALSAPRPRAEPAARRQVPGGEVMALTPAIFAGLESHRVGTFVEAFWSPDERKIATFSEARNAHIWSAKTGKQIAVLRGHKKTIGEVEMVR